MGAQRAAGAGPGAGPAGRRQSSGAGSQSRRERWDRTALRVEGLRTATRDLAGPWVSGWRAAPGSEDGGPRAIVALGTTRMFCVLSSRGKSGRPGASQAFISKLSSPALD